MKIYVSFDYDGCGDIFTEHFCHQQKTGKISSSLAAAINEPKAVFEEKFESKSAAIKRLDEELGSLGNDVVLLCGSLRQSSWSDTNNHEDNQNGLAHQVFPFIAQRFGWTFDNFLLKDVSDRVPAGTSFDSKCQKPYILSKYDRFKCLLLISQMIHIAMKAPAEEVEFRFYDDMREVFHNALKALRKNEWCIPANIKKITFRHYENSPYFNATEDTLKPKPKNQILLQAERAKLEAMQANSPNDEEAIAIALLLKFNAIGISAKAAASEFKYPSFLGKNIEARVNYSVHLFKLCTDKVELEVIQKVAGEVVTENHSAEHDSALLNTPSALPPLILSKEPRAEIAQPPALAHSPETPQVKITPEPEQKQKATKRKKWFFGCG